jgi:hypothetical protein
VRSSAKDAKTDIVDKADLLIDISDDTSEDLVKVSTIDGEDSRSSNDERDGPSEGNAA